MPLKWRVALCLFAFAAGGACLVKAGGWLSLLGVVFLIFAHNVEWHVEG